MKNHLDDILIFKTNISQLTADCDLHKTLNQSNGILQWNIDHEDCDCVLRVVSPILSSSDIIQLVQQHGYSCSELQ